MSGQRVLIVAPNSFAPIGVTSLEAPFQVRTSSGFLASLGNLRKLIHDGPGAPLDSGMKRLNPMAGYYLQSFLRQRGWDGHVVFDWSEENLERALECDPIAIGFSTTYVISPQMLSACLRFLRRIAGDLPIVVGGPYIYKQRLALRRAGEDDVEEYRKFGVDIEADSLFTHRADSYLRDVIYIASEFGEFTFLRVLEALEEGRCTIDDLASIPNLVLPASGNGWAVTGDEHEPYDLDRDYTRWDLVDSIPEIVPMRASVGCPYRCRFCDYIELHPKVTMRSPRSLMEEIRAIRQRGRSVVNFIDDNIFLTSARLEEVARTIVENELNIYWGGFFRVDRVDETNIDLIRESGLRFGYCGIESADDAMLLRIRKGCRRDELFDGIQLCSLAGINTLLTFIVGFPGETKESLDQTAAFINGLAVDKQGVPTYHAYPLYVSPITALDSIKLRREYSLTGRYMHWTHSTMTSDEASSMWCPYLFRRIGAVSYDYYGNDAGEWLSPSLRKDAFEARNELAVAFLDGADDERVQSAFATLHRAIAPDRHDVPPWQTFLAGRERQPGQARISINPV